MRDEGRGRRVEERILGSLDLSHEIDDAQILERIDAAILEEAGRDLIPLPERLRLRRDLYNGLRRFDVLQDLLEDPGITEIMVNGPSAIFVERAGQITPWGDHFRSQEKLEAVIQQIVARCDRMVNRAHPIADARLPDGSRVNIVLHPIALNGPALTIRRFPEPLAMTDLIRRGALDPASARFLQQAVLSGQNLFVCGGTGSGKTTFLNALSDYIPAGERVVSIEDNAELQIRHIPNLVRLEERRANLEGEGEISMRELIRTALRMRPDRVIVGEVRGAEAVDMLQAMNTGHSAMSTGHANSARDMLSRLETMVLMGMDIPVSAIRGQIASALDMILYLGRLRDGSRRLLEIYAVGRLVNGEIEMRRILHFEADEQVGAGGRWVFEERYEEGEKPWGE